jgi:hypothetical protein
MPIIAAICDGCGTVYSFGITLAGPASRAMVGHSTEPCPRCGSMGTVPDGLYDIWRHLRNPCDDSPRGNLALASGSVSAVCPVPANGRGIDGDRDRDQGAGIFAARQRYPRPQGLAAKPLPEHSPDGH